MIIFIAGSDTYSSRQYLNRTISGFKKKRDPQGLNVVVLQANSDEDSRIVSEIKATPFLAEKRLIVIKEALCSINKEILGNIIELIQNKGIPESNIVIFYQTEKTGKIKENKELEKILKNEEFCKKFEIMKGNSLYSWIEKYIIENESSIEKQALDYLTQNSGGDMWFLVTVLDQLIAYSGKEKISLNDVQLFLEEKIDDNIFNMTDAIISGNKKQAIKLLNKQRRLGEDEAKIFGLIIWQFRILLEMRSVYEQQDNITSDVIADKLGIHPFVARKNFYLIKRHSLLELKKIHNHLLDIDLKTKTGFASQSLLVDIFILKD